jgi:two-component system, OmpR family, response regulator RegX3
MRVLIVEDDQTTSIPLAEGLRREGYDVTCAATARDALDAGETDLVLLDLRLPDMEGHELFRHLRQRSGTPIIMLTGRASEADRIAGLELGADDYITKPFGFRELLARIRAITRRTSGQVTPRPLKAGPLEIDLRARRVTVEGQAIALTPKEFDLLALLARHPGEIVTRQQILADVWQTTWLGSKKTIDVHIVALRRKLGDPAWIETIRGRGLRLDVTGR